MSLTQAELDELKKAFPDDGVDPHMEATLAPLNEKVRRRLPD